MPISFRKLQGRLIAAGPVILRSFAAYASTLYKIFSYLLSLSGVTKIKTLKVKLTEKQDCLFIESTDNPQMCAFIMLLYPALVPVILTHVLDLDIAKMYLHNQNEVSGSRLSNRTDRQTDRRDRTHYHSRIGG